MSNPVKQLLDQIIKDMEENPEDFSATEYRLKYKDSYHIWIANGVGYYRVEYPVKLTFSFSQGRRFRKALNRWKAVHILSKIKEVKLKNAKNEINKIQCTKPRTKADEWIAKQHTNEN